MKRFFLEAFSFYIVIMLHYKFSLESVLLELEILNSGTITWEKKWHFCKDVSWIFEILEHLHLSELFQRSICSGAFSPVLDCWLHSCNCIERKLYYIFQIFFQSIRCSSVKTPLGSHLWQNFVEFRAVNYGPVF